MPKRDLYRVLGVSANAAPGEIKRAYRRIAFTVHPDVGERPDPERFREIHEAYEILSNPDRRRTYDVEIAVQQPFSAQPLRARREPVAVRDDFLAVQRSLGSLFDQIEQHFFGYRTKNGGPPRRLGVEAVLDAEEARFGCRVPFSVFCYVTCQRCGGRGEGWSLCPDCYGDGVVESTREVVIDIPPGASDGDRFEVLSDAGITNLLLEVRVTVT
ncbi:MAG TPA: DnaJ domain-containing protein [Candidatus Binataceae bacterium]|nr:DnaJ domain-containing protein [Candidatus Binataceae bacterium]